MKFQKQVPAVPEELDEPVVFFTKHPHLGVQVRKPKPMIVDGQRTLVDDIQVAFSPIGDGFGKLVTTDPVVADFLSRHPMVFGIEKYMELSTPPEVQLQTERTENERLMTQNNELLRRIAEFENAGKAG